MSNNKLNQITECNPNQIIPPQLEGGCHLKYLRDVCGGEYKGCNVGGWIGADGDTTSCTDCTDSSVVTSC